MGRMIDGEWVQSDVRIDEKNKKGEFIRNPVTFRNTISKDGPFKPEADRYHLYVSYACPWAHRTLMVRKLKGLDKIISFSVVSPLMLDDGWTFSDSYDQEVQDPINHVQHLREIYKLADDKFTGRVTVPILWDKKTKTIVNNESSEIIRIFNKEFAEFANDDFDFYPENLQSEIEKWNELIYPTVNNGVYRCGFATSQEAYEEAFSQLFSTLDQIESHLEGKSYLVGDTLTEADIRLFATLIRFDQVYHTHFKCNGMLIREYKNLSRYVNEINSISGIKETVNMDHIKKHYYYSHDTINPSRVVAVGPLER